MPTDKKPTKGGDATGQSDSEHDSEQSALNEAGEIDPKQIGSRARSLLRQAGSTISDGFERTQESVGPRIERTREAMAPRIDRAKEAGAAGAERAQRAAERAFGAEFRREFERYVNAATTTILGLHEDQAALRQRIANLEGELEGLKARLQEVGASSGQSNQGLQV